MVFDQKISKRAMRAAIISSCLGALAQTILRDSSIVILYANSLGASQFLSLLTTALPVLCTALLLIPIAHIMEYSGKKRLMLPSLYIGMAGFIMISAAGFFPENAKLILTFGLIVYSVTLAVFIAGWFPLLRGIIPESERGQFFGRLRVSWQSVLTLFLFFSSFFIARDAKLITLQIIIGISAFLIIGRAVFVSQIPEVELQKEVPSFIKSLKNVLKTKQLFLFSLYIFFLYLFSYSSVPGAFLFAKLELNAPDNYIVRLAFFANLGSILGYYMGGKVYGKYKTKNILFLINFIFIILNLLFLFPGSYNFINAFFLAGLVIVYSSVVALLTVLATSRIFALANPLVINMSLAIGTSFDNLGKGLSRIISGLFLDSGIFPEGIQFLGINMTPYRFLYLGYAIFLFIGLVIIRPVSENPKTYNNI